MAGPAIITDEALLLDAALENIPYGFCVWNSDFRLALWNRHYCDIYNFNPARLHRGMTLEEIVRYSAEQGNHPDETPEAFLDSYRRELLANRGGMRAKSREVLAGGRIIETAHAFSPGLGWVITHEDVTDDIARAEILYRRKAELERQNLRLDAAVNNISQGLSMFDAEGRLVICNTAYQRIYDLPKQYLKPGALHKDILAYLFEHGMSSVRDRESYLRWRRDANERREFTKSVNQLGGRSILLQHHPMKDGGWVTTHEDITEQLEREARITHLVRHDPLTDLPNRMHFLGEVASAEALIARGETVAVLFIDLDHFKAINDTLGHAMGDAVLKQVAARLRSATRDTDLLARLGADQFAILLRPVADPDEPARIAERIVGAVAGPFRLDGQQVNIGASIGIAMAPGDGSTADALLKNADLACFRAKSDGRSTYHFFEPGMDAVLQRRRRIEAGLRTALERDEFRVVFQPLVGLKENRVTCFEALLRWEQDGALVSPVEFIPVAEETGLIVQIGEWVLREACRIATGWRGEARVAVNMSPVQFRNPRLVELVQSALAEAGLAPGRLELEITESLLLNDSEQVLGTLHRLRQLGIRVALDDFGTGYSSLSYLRSFPFDKIKIDRSFMRDLSRNAESLAIIKAVIGLGHSLGMSMTAEGVETEDQLKALRTQGCDEIQGFLFSPPIAPEAVATLLESTGGRGFSADLKPITAGNITRLRRRRA